MYVCMCMYVSCLYLYRCMHKFVYVCVCISVCVCMYVCMYVCMAVIQAWLGVPLYIHNNYYTYPFTSTAVQECAGER